MLVSWRCGRIVDPVTVFASYHSYKAKRNFQLKCKHSSSPPCCPLFVKHTNDISKENVVSLNAIIVFLLFISFSSVLVQSSTYH
jgi:hypothetical protein